MVDARTYRFGDANRPGLLLGLSGRQAIPITAGVLFLAVILQLPVPPALGAVGPCVGLALAFGQWHGAPLVEVFVPGVTLLRHRAVGRSRWVRSSLLANHDDQVVPAPLRGLELVEPADRTLGVVRDRAAGTATAVVRVEGHGFPLASPSEQDTMLTAWGAALSPFAREQSPVRHVIWQEWTHPVPGDTHRAFLDAVGIANRRNDPEVVDYLALIDEQTPVTLAHDVLISVTVDLRRIRTRATVSRFTAAVDALAEEVRLFCARLEAAGLTVDGPLTALELSAAARVRSDPDRAAQVTTLARSLAAAARHGSLEWGPMVVEPDWRHVHVDGAFHRAYRVAGWPRLPVPGDWLSGLLAETACTRTVTVVLEPVPMGRAARAADREVMAREADSDLKEGKGFRVNARERKRLADAERRERELSEGHAEFAFVGLVTVTAPSLDQLDQECAGVEQAAAQCLLDLRPLDARHELGWVAALPFGRAVANSWSP